VSQHLEKILASVTARLEQRRKEVPMAALAQRYAELAPTRSLQAALRRPGKGGSDPAPLRVIGELKRKSPSAGTIRDELDASGLARELEAAGCRALSVLTEEEHFGGSLQSLASARSAVDLPLLRKDFIVDPYQLLEARVSGADAVLLLAAVLPDELLLAFRDRAAELGMEVLAEAHGAQELERILELDLPLVGCNARDLRTFEVDLHKALELCARVPPERVCVVESGILEPEQARLASLSPVDAALVGEGLMRGTSPGRRFAELFGEGPR
jgi:indole-3-glycerol phosphate synthase